MSRLAWVLLCSGCELVFPLKDRATTDAPIQPVVGCEDPDLFACFQFEDNLVDSSMRENSLVANDQFSFIPGIDGRALATTAESRIEFASPVKLDVQSELTIETWILTDATTGRDQTAIDHDACWALTITDTGNVACFAQATKITATKIDLGRWNHIACTQVDDQLEIFINGQRALTESEIDVRFDGCSQAAIGGEAPPDSVPETPLIGALDRFRVFNRVRLDTELMAEFTAFAAARDPR